jgi:hypothetical protein
VAKVGLEAQRILGESEFTDWESKIDAGSSSGPRFQHQNVRKTPHTAHKGGSREVSHVQKFNKQAAGREKMAQQLLSAGLPLSSIWEKSWARDGQREVAGDKGQWGFVLQGMRPAAVQAAEWWQGAVLTKEDPGQAGR